MAGNSTTVEFTIYTPEAVIRGVTNRGLYNSERTITFTDATAMLNGQPFRSGQKVTEYGDHTLVVTGKNGVVTTINFTIQPEPGKGPIDSSFKNVSAWAEEDIRYAQGVGLTDPVAKLPFTSLITREKFSEVAVKLHESLTGSKLLDYPNNPFTDTDNMEVIKAYHLGIVAGTSTSQFSPDALITREQLATMLKRVLDQTELTIPYGIKKEFEDKNDFSAYAIDAIDYLSSVDIIKGMSEHAFASKENASIEQALVMAKRMFILAKGDALSSDAKRDDMIFGDGDMFIMYVEETVNYPGVEGETNIYALKNNHAFTLPAHSAIYVTTRNDGKPPANSLFGTLIAVNHSNQTKTIKADSIHLSLKGLYYDRALSIRHPDGTIEEISTKGPFVRMVIFDGIVDSEKSLFDLYDENHVLDLGSWFTVPHEN